MKRLEYTVSFATPAFLGNAEQASQWRTPPFKALLRQWWRVAETAGRRPELRTLHAREGGLFGRAADEGTTASQVRLRMDWRGGTVPKDRWKSLSPVIHPEVTHKAGADQYLAYGPVVGSKLKRETFIPAGERCALTLGVPESEETRFKDIAKLAHVFGSVGSRCRNGWGSLHYEKGGLSAAEIEALLEPANRAGRDWLRALCREWRQALDTDWCHALGKDDNGLLLWRTDTIKKWEDLLKFLAEVKIAFRTQFCFKGGDKHAVLCDRQVLAYPITNHELREWEFVKDEKTAKPRKDSSRSANQVFFKVLPSNGGYVGLVAHLPHGLPAPLKDRLSKDDQATLDDREKKVWREVHAVLDKNLTRLP